MNLKVWAGTDALAVRREISGGVGSDRLAGEKPGHCFFVIAGSFSRRSPLHTVLWSFLLVIS